MQTETADHPGAYALYGLGDLFFIGGPIMLLRSRDISWISQQLVARRA